MAVENYEVVIAGNCAGQYVATVLHAKCTIATTVNPYLTALLLIQDIDSGDVLPAWLDCLPAAYTITSLRARKIGSGGGVTAVLLGGVLSGNVGLRSAGVSTSAVNPVLTFVGAADVNSPGRVFLPGVAEDDIDDNILGSSLVVAMGVFGEEWKDGGTLGGVDTWVGGIYRRVPNTIDLIAASQASPMIGNQRRRLRPI